MIYPSWKLSLFKSIFLCISGYSYLFKSIPFHFSLSFFLSYVIHYLSIYLSIYPSIKLRGKFDPEKYVCSTDFRRKINIFLFQKCNYILLGLKN